MPANNGRPPNPLAAILSVALLLEHGATRLIGLDRDADALRVAAQRLAAFGDRVELVHSDYRQLGRVLDERSIAGIDGALADLGVSSMQLDQAARGFSFQKDGPLDMRMSQAGPSAADLVNTLSEAALADILFQYGEERAARRIARAIVADRRRAPFETTLQLAGLIERVLPRPKPGQPHPATG